MEIPGIIFIIVGIIISYVTSKIEGMEFFYLLGAGFILWGIIKLARKAISKRILGSGPEKKESKTEYSQSQSTQNVIPCPNCGLKHYANANYCQNCGAKLK
jgi:hypothetical protein